LPRPNLFAAARFQLDWNCPSRAILEETIDMTKTFAAAFVIAALIGAPALAFAEGTCVSNATDKKLAGAAKTSFMTKCEKDAKASCDSQAAEKKLAGAAKTSFTKKCVADATGE
jgi:hypothetical protein